MKLPFKELLPLSLLFSALALYLVGSAPSVFHTVLVVIGLMPVLAFVMVTDRSRL